MQDVACLQHFVELISILIFVIIAEGVTSHKCTAQNGRKVCLGSFKKLLEILSKFQSKSNDKKKMKLKTATQTAILTSNILAMQFKDTWV